MTVEQLDEKTVVRMIERELARRHWKLAAEPSLFAPGDTFTMRVTQRVHFWIEERGFAKNEKCVVDAIVHEYCRLLHHAVSWNGSHAQTAALQETIDCAWPVALKRCADRDVAESAILRAVNQLWQNIDKCDPGAYLAFFCKILLREIGQELRRRKRQNIETSEADLPRPGDQDDADADPLELFKASGWQGHAAFSLIDLEASRPSLFMKIRRCLQNAHREFIIQAHYWGELRLPQIALLLNQKVEQVTQKKFRALEHMRDHCPDVAQELILLLTP